MKMKLAPSPHVYDLFGVLTGEISSLRTSELQTRLLLVLTVQSY